VRPEKNGFALFYRCIITLKPEYVEAWLTPQSHSTAELQSMLSDRTVPLFQHEILKAA
jgi:hypothetical protein